MLKPVLVVPSDDEGRLLAKTLGINDERRVSAACSSAFDLMRSAISLGIRFRTRLVHSHGFTSAVAALPAAILLRQRHVVTVHDVVTQGLLRKTNKLRLLALGLTLRQAYAVHAVSDDCAETLKLIPFMRTARNIRVITNGINVSQFTNVTPMDVRSEIAVDRDVFLFGFFGRFMAQKGFRTLIDAVAIIERDKLINNFCVVSFGTGGFIREENAYIRRLNLAHRFFFHEPLENPAPAMAGVDAIVMPSRWEAFGLLAAEALTVGVPLIASDCIGLRQVVRDTPARTFRVDDAAGLAAAMVAEASNPTIARAIDFSATAAMRFDVSESTRRVSELLNRAISGEPLAASSEHARTRQHGRTPMIRPLLAPSHLPGRPLNSRICSSSTEPSQLGRCFFVCAL